MLVYQRVCIHEKNWNCTSKNWRDYHASPSCLIVKNHSFMQKAPQLLSSTPMKLSNSIHIPYIYIYSICSISHVLHGAGIFTNICPYPKSPSLVGKYTSTMVRIWVYPHCSSLHYWLVVSTPLKNMKVGWDHYSQLNGKKHVPNHHFLTFSLSNARTVT